MKWQALKRKNECECLKGDVEIIHREIKELEDKIKSAPTEFIDIVNIRDSILATTHKTFRIDD